MRPAFRRSVEASIDRLRAGELLTTDGVSTLLMAVREKAKGHLLDLADCVAHDDRDKGRAHSYITRFVHQMLHGMEQSGELESRTMHPIRNVIGDLNRVLKQEGINHWVEAKDQRTRQVLAFSIASALNATKFSMDGRRCALVCGMGEDGFPTFDIFIQIPELWQYGYEKVEAFATPWLLADRDRKSDWTGIIPEGWPSQDSVRMSP